MNKKIAIIGAGAIGSLLGGHMTRGGEDVTLIAPFWREHVEAIRKEGLIIKSPAGEQVVPVKALFIDELSQLKDKIEVLFIAVKSNDTEKMLNLMKPYLAEDVWVISPQNGINEDVIVPIVGKENTIGCVATTGGRLEAPGYVVEGGGGRVGFIVGELDGQITPRVKEVARLTGMWKQTEITTNIMLERWNKLAAVCMSGPVGAIGGLGLRGIFENEKAHQVCARIEVEVIEVAKALGYNLEAVMRVKADDWKALAKGPLPEIERVISEGGSVFPDVPVGTAADIMRGRPLEIEYTNGYVVKRGREVEIPTPANEILISMVKDVESGKIKPGLEQLDEFLKLTG